MLLHLDADAFFASVLQRKNPQLKGKPLLALGMGGACVIAASYEAKAKGVKTGMPVREAIKLCPEAIQMPADFRETGIASQQIEAILMDLCPIIEQYSIDEWFLDLRSCVGGVPRDLASWAKEVQLDVKRRTDIGVSIGIGPSKLLAKMASEYRKPAGITIVADRRDVRFAGLYNEWNALDILSFLQDRPAAAIPGIGRKREVHTKEHHWETAWEFANAQPAMVQKLFGKPGPELQRELLGERISEVHSEHDPPKSVSRTRTFRATKHSDLLWAHILHHAQYVILKMRRKHLACQGISVWLRDRDYHHFGTSKRLPELLDTEEALTPFLRLCFEETFDPRVLYNQAGMCLWGLTPSSIRQTSLFEDPSTHDKEERLQASLDLIRKRFGREVIGRGSALSAKEKSRPGLDTPLYGQEN